ncbi:MAG TPA: TIGR04282 family arsenosugar biosynthesis glycosyltransferase [Pyrinomonadaceae bacterium]
MAKVPVTGTVKTRLQPILSPEKCVGLAEAFLYDTIKKAKTVCENVILAYAPAGQKKILESIIPSEIVLIEQKGENLGERMANAFVFTFSEYSPVVMIGTDSPTFPAEYITEAFDALERDAEIVLGKAKDGGFYLIGLRTPIPNLFDEIAWSSSAVFEQITRNIKNLGIEKLKLIPEHYDVDTPNDFLVMKKEIFADSELQKVAEKTYRWLLQNS